ncbi:MAG: tyrosine-type recombinase/integrase [Promethearchaeota archaeon]
MKYSKNWLSKSEYQKLINLNADQIKWRDLLIIKLTYSGAFRISEVLIARREDLSNDPYSQLVLKKQKTDKKNWEVQPINDDVYDELIRYCNERGIKTQDYLFPSSHGGHISYNAFYKALKRYCKKADIQKDITTHSLRRSRAVHLLDEGNDVYFVKEFLRHKNIETTMHYLKLDKSRISEVINSGRERFSDRI